ncbi:MAG: type IV pilus biogenesis/stability protein PilW [Syntrophobacteraceae bacterium]
MIRIEDPTVRTARYRSRMESDEDLQEKLKIDDRAGRLLRLASSFCVLLLVCALVFGGCAKKKVYLPKEWQTPLPQQGQEAPGQAGPAVRQDAPLSSSQPHTFLLKAPAAIKESDLPLTGDDTPWTVVERQPAEQPERLASMHVVEQANAALAQGKPDVAIPLLEQAIQVDVYNGEAFFGLARAWRMKGSRQKSLEFARKAEIIFQDDHPKLKEVYLFESDVYKEMGSNKKADQYRQKASKL